MINFKDCILGVVGGEFGTAVIVVDHLSYGLGEKAKNFPVEFLGKPVLLKEVIDYLDYEFHEGYGVQECHNVFIWLVDKVFFVHEYDGSTFLDYVPRHPTKSKEVFQ